MRSGPIGAGLVRTAGMLAAMLAGMLAAVLGGCAGGDTVRVDTAAGCTPPANESELLDAYAAEAVFDVRPPEARDVQERVRSVACRIEPDWPNDPSETAVTQYMATSVPYDAAALYTMYDPVATGQGWRPVATIGRDAPALRYCRQVDGVTSYLSITVATPRPEVGVRGPGGATPSASPPVATLFHFLSVRIAAAPQQPACRG